MKLIEGMLKQIIPNENNNISEYNFPKIQIINKRIDPKKLNNGYYQRLKCEIKKQIKEETQILIINLIPKTKINEKFYLKALLLLSVGTEDIIKRKLGHYSK